MEPFSRCHCQPARRGSALVRPVEGDRRSADGYPRGKMDILISGAGVAGLPAAYWLRRFGFRPTVVERARSLVAGGYKIDVRGAALDVFRRMGAHDAVVEASTRMRGAVL